MATLYLDCSMGAAGDMLSAALLELLPNPDAAVAELNALGIPGVEYVRERVSRCGLAATHLSVRVHGEEEGAGEPDHDDHHHDHDHDHHDHSTTSPLHHSTTSPLHHSTTPPLHHSTTSQLHQPSNRQTVKPSNHHHHSLAEILATIESLPLAQPVADDAKSVYRLLAEAEGRAHARPAEAVHFHEVGSLDAIADIVAFCHLLAKIGPDEVVVSPVHVGRGTVACAHGILPVPAPCTAFLLEGIPAYSDGTVEGELCTPTGAALIRRFATRFGQLSLTAIATGYGAGRRDLPRANVVRAVLGEPFDAPAASSPAPAASADDVLEICFNVDDMTGEDLAFAADEIRAAGALDVCEIPAIMKKGRPGTVFVVLCRPGDRDRVLKAVFGHTTTIGVREALKRRAVLRRREETAETVLGAVRRKVSEGFGVTREKFEHDDLAAIARKIGTERRP